MMDANLEVLMRSAVMPYCLWGRIEGEGGERVSEGKGGERRAGYTRLSVKSMRES
jgi:hypothetical protein